MVYQKVNHLVKLVQCALRGGATSRGRKKIRHLCTVIQFDIEPPNVAQ